MKKETETRKKWVSASACITLGQGRIGQKSFLVVGCPKVIIVSAHVLYTSGQAGQGRVG